MAKPWMIVKVGGSLFELPDLRTRLNAWLTERAADRMLLLPGGGRTADAIRALDRIHHLGEESSHWLAIRAMSLNAHFLKELLPSAPLVTEIADDLPTSSPCGILDPLHFFRADEMRRDALPSSWQVTSDSLALRLAILTSARELILLKSADGRGSDWHAASDAHLVDGYFTEALRQAPAGLRIRIVNLRAWKPGMD